MANEFAQPYVRIVEDLRDKIRHGHLKAHDKLPSTRTLAGEYGVAPGTVQRALAELRASGAIYSHQGRGSFVHAQARTSDTASSESEAAPLEQQVADLAAKVAELTDRLNRVERRLE